MSANPRAVLLETTIVLDRPDEHWGKSLRWAKTCAYNLTTPDGGTTWNIQLIAMAPHWAPHHVYTKTGYRKAGDPICDRPPTDYYWWPDTWYPNRPPKLCWKDNKISLCAQP
jgi:hypothetical protein